MSKQSSPAEEDMRDSGGDKQAKNVFTWAVIAVGITWAAFGFALYNDPNRGTFGDMYGGLNTLFSGLAFAALIYAAIMQRMELRLQRLDLRATREELKRSAAAQELSEAALRVQADAASQSARLAAVNALLEHYKAELRNLTNGIEFPNNSSIALRLRLKIDKLTEILDATYNELEQQCDDVKRSSSPMQEAKPQ